MFSDAYYLCRQCRKQQRVSHYDDKPTPCECGGELYFMPRQLLMPEATKLADVFESATAFSLMREKNVPGAAPEESGKGFISIDPFEPLFSKRKPKKPTEHRVPILAFCGVDGGNGMHLKVRPTDAAVAAISSNWIGDASRERVNLRVNLRDDGTALVTSSNSLILASRWLALLDAAEVRALLESAPD